LVKALEIERNDLSSEQASSGRAALAEWAVAAPTMKMAITREARVIVESMLPTSSVANGIHSSLMDLGRRPQRHIVV
jgi:hypothetical protein